MFVKTKYIGTAYKIAVQEISPNMAVVPIKKKHTETQKSKSIFFEIPV